MLNQSGDYFDLLSGDKSPFTGFGTYEIEPSIDAQKFIDSAESTIARVNEMFDVRLGTATCYASNLDDIISAMWNDGWHPCEGNFTLFARDFGLCFTHLLYRDIGGKLVFRSCDILDHLSLWWPDSRIEIFPFHKVAKALSERNGNSLDQLRRGVREMLSLAG